MVRFVQDGRVFTASLSSHDRAVVKEMTRYRHSDRWFAPLCGYMDGYLVHSNGRIAFRIKAEMDADEGQAFRWMLDGSRLVSTQADMVVSYPNVTKIMPQGNDLPVTFDLDACKAMFKQYRHYFHRSSVHRAARAMDITLDSSLLFCGRTIGFSEASAQSVCVQWDFLDSALTLCKGTPLMIDRNRFYENHYYRGPIYVQFEYGDMAFMANYAEHTVIEDLDEFMASYHAKRTGTRPSTPCTRKSNGNDVCNG